MYARNPIAELFSMLTLIGFLLIFFSPIIISFALFIYNSIKCLKSTKGSEERTKYKKRAIGFIIAFVCVLSAYVAFFYWISINWRM